MQNASREVRYGVWLQNGYALSVEQVVAFGVEAEKAGWGGVFVSDEPSNYSDPWTALAAIAAQTERIRLGTWVTPVPNNLPWRLAHILASLDHISGGRVILGTGLGTPYEYKAFGGSYDARALGRKYDEALEIITRLWSGEAVSLSGEFFTLKDAKLAVTPVQTPRIPILMACWWPHKKPFRRAARWDGMMPYWPALTSEGQGPQGEEATGSIEEELQDLLAYYHQLTDEPGEIVLPYRPDEGYLDLCKELEATWMLVTDVQEVEEIRQGPPG